MVEPIDTKSKPADDTPLRADRLAPSSGKPRYVEDGKLLDLTNPEHEEIYHQNGLTVVIRSIAGETSPLLLSVTIAQLDQNGREEDSIQFTPSDGQLIRLKAATTLMANIGTFESSAIGVLREIVRTGLTSGGIIGRGQIEAAFCTNFEGFEERATIPELHIEQRPVETIRPVGVMQELIGEPRDPRTGCYTREVLYRPDFIKRIRELLGDEIEVYVMDYNHCRVANANEMRAIVDRILTHHPQAIQEAFDKRGLPCIQVRLGGDEFMVLTKSTPGAIESILEGSKRAENFARCWLYSHPNYSEADKASRLRDAERNERHRFLDLIGGKSHFSIGKWCHYYILKLSELGIDGHRLAPPEMALRLARNAVERPKTQDSLMQKTVSDGARLSLQPDDDQANIRLILRGIGQCDRSISERKLSAAPVVVQPLDPEIKDRRATVHAIARVSEVVQRFAERLLRIKEAKLSGVDVNGLRESQETLLAFRERSINPLINHDLQRYPQIRTRPASEVLGIFAPQSYLAVRIDINAFGKLNHNEGSDRADEIKAGIVALAAREFPGVFMAEEGGGGILVLLPNPEDRSYSERLPKLLQRLNQYMYFALNRQVFEAGRMEHQIDKALGRALSLGKEFKTRGKYGKISMEMAQLDILPEPAMEIVYTDFTRSPRRRVSAPKRPSGDHRDFLTAAREILEVEAVLAKRR
ncbi:MAG: hypothetical protein K1X83_11215 [Oligoflexia bacterium]|nr:hypothetical protein [Oligoflexia bacterium]